MRKSTERALSLGALRPISTISQCVEQDGIRFVVRVVSNLTRKKEDGDRRKSPGTDFNPFLPYDERLFVADISDTHVCLLNKFNVIDHHLLVVTRKFESQESLLTLEDFGALQACLAEFDGLAFYNAGQTAGASQRHKHLQLVPLPIANSGPRMPIEQALSSMTATGSIGRSAGLPFCHAFAGLDLSRGESTKKSAQTLHDIYRAMLRYVGLESGENTQNHGSVGAYNLLATRQWMLLVPRSQASYESISVNALGFAGTFLVRDEAQLRTLTQFGPMTVLKNVALPAKGD